MAGDLPPPEGEGEVEGGAEGEVEVVGVPGHVVVPVEDVGVRVVPRPVHELHRHDVVGDVHQHLRQPRCDQPAILEWRTNYEL